MVVQAERQAGHWREMWRISYGYGPRDPRFTEMSDEDILFDMILRKEHERRSSGDETASMSPEELRLAVNHATALAKQGPRLSSEEVRTALERARMLSGAARGADGVTSDAPSVMEWIEGQ